MPKETNASTFKTENDRLIRANKRLSKKNASLTSELELAKRSLLKIKADYENRVKNSLKLDIQESLECTDVELAKLTRGKTVDQLEQMLVNFTTAIESRKSPYAKDSKPITASIRPAIANYPGARRLTVGDLFNKTPEQIREMKGDF